MISAQWLAGFTGMTRPLSLILGSASPVQCRASTVEKAGVRLSSASRTGVGEDCFIVQV